jgi:hypothetical protein
MQDDMTASHSRHGRGSTIDAVMVGVVVLVMATLAVQPLLVTRQADRQSEFAWEMFSKSAPKEEFVIFFVDREETVTPAEVLEPARANLDYTVVLPAWLCDQHPEAVSVATHRNEERIGVLECGSP